MTTDTILSTTLASILQQLADFFGMTTEAIMQNAPYWLARYGWFSAVQNLPTILIVPFVAIGMTALLSLPIWLEYDLNKFKFRYIVIAYFLCVFIASIANFIPCAITPEIYGLNELLKLLK